MESGNATVTIDARKNRTRNVAVLTDRAERLALLEPQLRRFAGGEVDSLRVWVSVERFRAPSSTHVPYRNLARIEARNITAARLARAEAQVAEAMGDWSKATAARVEAIADASVEDIVERVKQHDINLLVCEAASGVVRLAERVAALTGRSVLLIADEDGDAGAAATNQGMNPAARLLRAIHG